MKKLVLLVALTLPAVPVFADAPKPDALVADGIPAVPDALSVETRPYMEFRTASFSGWHPTDKSMLVATRFANTALLHRGAGPMMDRRQISFEAEPVGNGNVQEGLNRGHPISRQFPGRRVPSVEATGSGYAPSPRLGPIFKGQSGL